MRLDRYQKGDYTIGAPLWQWVLWYVLGDHLVRSDWLPFSSLKVWVLRCFGAKLGQQVRLKNGIRVKFPWRLVVGDRTWIGEEVWIDNLATVTLGSDVCVSQGVYFCTGNHDWGREDFCLRTAPIHLEDQVWLAAKTIVAPGVTLGEGTVVILGSTVLHSLKPWTICGGHPAIALKPRPRSRAEHPR
ncbi:MAG: colanic acid biosynthesis acetyltransferase WcaF [Oscillatoriales cyanobacterium SM2_2_1]|nr:colanic acid biosynthesis acetyltransferase WcaF [Oscillatoriales cyanobacterium SM2_2_1]